MGTGGSGSSVGDTYGSHDDGLVFGGGAGKDGSDQTPLIDDSLIEELKSRGEKFTQEDVQFITKDKTGQIVWLEKGSETVGLDHIRARNHDQQFVEKFGQEAADTTRFLRDVVKNGRVVSSKITTRNGREGYTRIYEYNGSKLILAGIGLNGFLVTAYPI